MCWHTNLSFRNIWSSLGLALRDLTRETISAGKQKTREEASKQFYFFTTVLFPTENCTSTVLPRARIKRHKNLFFTVSTYRGKISREPNGNKDTQVSGFGSRSCFCIHTKDGRTENAGSRGPAAKTSAYLHAGNSTAGTILVCPHTQTDRHTHTIC